MRASTPTSQLARNWFMLPLFSKTPSLLLAHQMYGMLKILLRIYIGLFLWRPRCNVVPLSRAVVLVPEKWYRDCNLATKPGILCSNTKPLHQCIAFEADKSTGPPLSGLPIKVVALNCLTGAEFTNAWVFPFFAFTKKMATAAGIKPVALGSAEQRHRPWATAAGGTQEQRWDYVKYVFPF